MPYAKFIEFYKWKSSKLLNSSIAIVFNLTFVIHGDLRHVIGLWHVIRLSLKEPSIREKKCENVLKEVKTLAHRKWTMIK